MMHETPTIDEYRPWWLLGLLALALTVGSPRPALALGAMGEVVVNIDGFEGWTQRRDVDLEIHFAGRVTNTTRGGVFVIRDLQSLDAAREFSVTPAAGGRELVYVRGDSTNFTRILVGRKRASLPISWQGELRDNIMVFKPIDCELVEGGMGGCTVREEDLDVVERRIRQRAGLPIPGRLQPPAQPQMQAEPAQPAAPAAPPAVAEPVAPMRPAAPPPPPPPPRPKIVPEPDIVEPLPLR